MNTTKFGIFLSIMCLVACADESNCDCEESDPEVGQPETLITYIVESETRMLSGDIEVARAVCDDNDTAIGGSCAVFRADFMGSFPGDVSSGELVQDGISWSCSAIGNNEQVGVVKVFAVCQEVE